MSHAVTIYLSPYLYVGNDPTYREVMQQHELIPIIPTDAVHLALTQQVKAYLDTLIITNAEKKRMRLAQEQKIAEDNEKRQALEAANAEKKCIAEDNQKRQALEAAKAQEADELKRKSQIDYNIQLSSALESKFKEIAQALIKKDDEEFDNDKQSLKGVPFLVRQLRRFRKINVMSMHASPSIGWDKVADDDRLRSSHYDEIRTCGGVAFCDQGAIPSLQCHVICSKNVRSKLLSPMHGIAMLWNQYANSLTDVKTVLADIKMVNLPRFANWNLTKRGRVDVSGESICVFAVGLRMVPCGQTVTWRKS